MKRNNVIALMPAVAAAAAAVGLIKRQMDKVLKLTFPCSPHC